MNDKNLQFFYLWGAEGSGKSHLSEVVKRNNILVIEDIETKNNIEQIEVHLIYLMIAKKIIKNFL